jgi:tetratricopeptide (TPR) repeat protein
MMPGSAHQLEFHLVGVKLLILMRYLLLLGCTVTLLVAAADVAMAKTSVEVESAARSTTVEIKLQTNKSVGSGVIVHRQGNLYTLATNRHVVCGGNRCQQLPTGENYQLGLVDGQKYQVSAKAIKLLGDDLDLAIIQFRSNRQYTVAPISSSEKLKVDDVIYTAGFPSEQPGFSFNQGRAIAVVNKRLTKDEGGYGIIYRVYTAPGMSGGGVFDGNGQLVAIHGIGDRQKPGTDIDDDSKLNTKIGYNRGIPVRWLIQSLRVTGINLGVRRSLSEIQVARPEVPATADEYFIAGFNKYVEPGNNVVAGKNQAIQEFTTAIRLNPRYTIAYFLRGYVHNQIQDFTQAVSDYNQAISLDPNFAEAYNNRGNVKTDLQDLPGALADFNQSIVLNPTDAYAFNNRGILKKNLNDIPGALADYNQAIILDPKYPEAYSNRGNLKSRYLNDLPGALQDLNQSIALNPQIAPTYINRGVVKKKLNDFTGAMADYNQALALNPKQAKAYNNRGNLKAEKLQDLPGALADYNQAIKLYPQYGEAYNNRGNVKEELNDLPGALADFNQAIILNPTAARTYGVRGLLKAYKLNDRAGGIKDLRRAAQLFRQQGQTNYLELAISELQKLGATE